MKSKLVKNELPYGYFLYDEKGDLIASTIKGYKKQPLSLKNCEAIANGYDLDELAREDTGDIRAYSNYIKGFQKALEILGDQKFSEDDMIREILIWDNHINIHEEDKGCVREISQRVKSLQQTEWDVEIEMENINDGLDEMAQTQFYKQPKLDADGCLILKHK